MEIDIGTTAKKLDKHTKTDLRKQKIDNRSHLEKSQ